MSHHMKNILRLGVAPAILHSVYANTLTPLIPDLYAGLYTVSRELVGFIPSVARNSTAERAAVGQNVDWPIAPAGTASDISPSMTIPEPDDRDYGAGVMTIQKSRGVNFGWTGEEQLSIAASVGDMSLNAQNFAQALRTLTNEVETDLALEAALNASRATGTPGTAPYLTDVGASAQLRKILDDNGAPGTGRSQVISTSVGANLRTLYQLTKVNEAGSSMTLRQGELLDLHNMSIKESAQAYSHTSSATAGVTTDTTGYAVGSTVITVSGSGHVVGDVITFAGDTSQYVIVAVDAGTPTITLGGTGLLQALPASNVAITTLANYDASVAFSQNAIQLATRAPALPKEGDAAIDRMSLVDPRSGLVFEISIYAGYRKVRYEVALAWGVKAVQGEHIAALIS